MSVSCYQTTDFFGQQNLTIIFLLIKFIYFDEPDFIEEDICCANLAEDVNGAEKQLICNELTKEQEKKLANITTGEGQTTPKHNDKLLLFLSCFLIYIVYCFYCRCCKRSRTFFLLISQELKLPLMRNRQDYIETGRCRIPKKS